MALIQLTHWRLDYVMNLSIGALHVLLGAEESQKPKGMLAEKTLNKAELEKMGLKVKE